MLISEAFAKFKAKQKNVQWSVSAFNDDGDLVLSLWKQYFKPIEINGERAMQYIDRASRWNGHGNTEFRSNLDLAKDNRSIIRAIIARTNSPESVERGDDASKLKNTFATKEDWVGTLTKWDSDNFEIVFTLHKKCYFAEHFIKKKNAQIDS